MKKALGSDAKASLPPSLQAGAVAVHDGPVMAAGNRLLFTITGHGGHAALPHLTRDPMIAAAHLLLALQSIVSMGATPIGGPRL